MLEQASLESILDRHGRDPASIIAILQDIQSEINWLPEENLRYIAQALSIPLTKMMRLASFYRAFSLKPRGRHIVQICLGTACHVRGAVRILGAIERELGIGAGETDERMEFTLETVNCLGACALGPVVVVDDVYHGQMTSAKATRLLKQLTRSNGNGAGDDAEEK